MWIGDPVLAPAKAIIRNICVKTAAEPPADSNVTIARVLNKFILLFYRIVFNPVSSWCGWYETQFSLLQETNAFIINWKYPSNQFWNWKALWKFMCWRETMFWMVFQPYWNFSRPYFSLLAACFQQKRCSEGDILKRSPYRVTGINQFLFFI